jgi:hypothetical protein
MITWVCGVAVSNQIQLLCRVGTTVYLLQALLGLDVLLLLRPTPHVDALETPGTDLRPTETAASRFAAQVLLLTQLHVW